MEAIGIILAILVPIFALPIVVILIKHQQKMAELMGPNGGHGGEVTQQQWAMNQEMVAMRQAITDLTLTVDRLSSEVKALQAPSTPSLASRLENEAQL